MVRKRSILPPFEQLKARSASAHSACWHGGGMRIRKSRASTKAPALDSPAPRMGHRFGWYRAPFGHAASVLVLSLVIWPMDRIRHADAYTMEQMRRADYTTNCGLGFAGLHCNEVITCEELDYCNGHGICQRGGYCICDTGWEGSACTQSSCPSGCSGHGSCAATGGCVCDAGFTGIICDQVICLGGGNCTGHGTCLQGGICECEKGYLGGACDVVDVAEKCSNHGKSRTMRAIAVQHELAELRSSMHLRAHAAPLPRQNLTYKNRNRISGRARGLSM